MVQSPGAAPGGSIAAAPARGPAAEPVEAALPSSGAEPSRPQPASSTAISASAAGSGRRTLGSGHEVPQAEGFMDRSLQGEQELRGAGDVPATAIWGS